MGVRVLNLWFIFDFFGRLVLRLMIPAILARRTTDKYAGFPVIRELKILDY